MPQANSDTYLSPVLQLLQAHWPDNRRVNIACHGHSVPAGYFATPQVNSLEAYPHLLLRALKERFPFAVVNVVVTAVGGENSEQGAARFDRDVLCFQPDVVSIDYGLNDRGIGLERARASWAAMIEQALAQGTRVLLLTPTADQTYATDAGKTELGQHADQIRALAEAYGVGLVDSLAAFDDYLAGGGALSDMLSWVNHPNRQGHELVARELLRYFPPWLSTQDK